MNALQSFPSSESPWKVYAKFVVQFTALGLLLATAIYNYKTTPQGPFALQALMIATSLVAIYVAFAVHMVLRWTVVSISLVMWIVAIVSMMYIASSVALLDVKLYWLVWVMLAVATVLSATKWAHESRWIRNGV